LAEAGALGEADFDAILRSAREWLASPVLSTGYQVYPDKSFSAESRCRSALDLALRDGAGHRYSGGVPTVVYDKLLERLTKQVRKQAGDMAMNKIAADKANELLGRLDRLASKIQERHASWGMPFEAARDIVNDLDKVADEIEEQAFGKESMLRRQVEVLKTAKVLEKDADEAYMGAYENPMKPHQVDADEPYMKAYGDDQSSAVRSGKSSSGRPLAP